MNSNSEGHGSIEALLLNTIPRASDVFEKQLEENLLAQFDAAFKPKKEHRIFSRKLHRHRLWVLGGAALAILLVAIFMIPATRSVAKEMLLDFNRAINEIISVNFLVVDGEDQGHDNQLDVEVDTIKEASQRAGFSVKIPQFLPDGFRLVKIAAVEGQGGVGLRYTREEYGYIYINQYDPQKTYLVTECKSVVVEANATVDEEGQVTTDTEDKTEAETDSCGDLAGIGVDAEIIEFQIGDGIGQLVIGGWNAIPVEPDTHDADPGETVTYDFVWDPEKPEYQLRWEDEGIAYSVKILDRRITTDEIIAFANSFR
jgi:hypothetical protein